MKNFFILFIGEPGIQHLNSIFNIPNEYKKCFKGWCSVYDKNSEKLLTKVKNQLDLLYKDKIEPIIMKGGNIHTEDYIRPIIKYYKTKHPNDKFFLSHCACFDSFILTDGALLTKYTKENIESVIKNAIELRDKLQYNTNKNIVMLNAGGDTNPNTAPEYWMEIYNNLPKETDNYKLEMTQLDVAISETVRIAKLGSNTELPTIIIPSCINEGNSIWKTLTIVAKQSLAGIVMGLPMYIGLTSRTDTEESIYKTLITLIKLTQTDKE